MNRKLSILMCIALLFGLIPAYGGAAHAAAPANEMQLVSGYYHDVGLTTSGKMLGWGGNEFGGLADGTDVNRSKPVAAKGMTEVASVAAGVRQSFAVKKDGTVWAWGSNNHGQLGDGTTTNQWLPVQIAIDGVASLSGGIGYHTLALKVDGTVWSWGKNDSGELGDGTTTSRSVPAEVPGLTNMIAVSAGGYHSIALKADGTVWAWGLNTAGEMGNGTESAAQATPVQVTGLDHVIAISAGNYHNLALKENGTVWAWGENSWGAVGDGTTTKRIVPVQVQGISDVVAVSAGGWHSLALKADGTLWAWGYNNLGQVGDGSTTTRKAPVQVTGLTDVAQIAAGAFHSGALRSDGSFWGWGFNDYGQLGNGTVKDSSVPAQSLVWLDDTAPALTSGTISASDVTTNSATLAWTKATDNMSGQADLQYRVYRSFKNNLQTVADIESKGIAVNAYTANADSLPLTGLLDGMPYYFNVIVKDKAGNKTAYTMQQVVTVAIPTYSVIYRGNGNTGGKVPIDDYYYYEEEQAEVLGNPRALIRTGYTFAGWNTAADGTGTPYAEGDQATIGQEDLVLYAQWSKNPTYRVLYDGNGETDGTGPSDSEEYEAGAAAIVMSNIGGFVKSGYTFAGWNTEADGSGKPYAAGATLPMAAADVTLYAQWTLNPTYGVTYEAGNADSGSVPVDAGTFEAGAEVTVQGNTGSLAKSGYTFAGWTLAADGSGTAYKAGDKLTMGAGNVTLHAKWTANPTYHVTYDAGDTDGGTAPTDAAAYEAGAEVSVQGNTGNLAKTGHTFAGWTLSADGSGTVYKAGDKLTMGAAEITLHAKWTVNPTYHVTYDASDADNGTVPTDAAAYEAGAEVTVQGNTGSLAKSGYTFAGWTLSADGTGAIYKADDKLTMGAGNVTLHAKWTANPTYHVTYEAGDADSGTVPTDAAAYEAGAEVTVQGNTGNLAKSGYAFAGWTLSADGSGTVYKAGDKLTMGAAEITLHAKWTANPTYQVTYDAGDADSGSVPVDAGTYEAGAEVTVQGNTGSLAKSGYTFAGWTLSADGSGTVYKASDKLTMGAAEITLHAKWTVNPTYHVTYDASDADNGTVPTDAAAYEAGAEVTVQGNTGSLAKSGYTFAGWTLSADGTGAIYKADDKLTMGAGNVTLHAKWTANPTYHVTYDASDADSGTVPTDAAAYEAGAEVTVQGNTGSLAKSGYTFAGWTLAADGSGAIYKAGDKLTIGAADVTLHAKWTANPTYHVTYDAGDADSGTVPTDAAAYEAGAEITVQGNTGSLAKSGYTFAGWTLAADGSGTAYKAGDKLTMGAGNVTLHAKWTANLTYQVTYDASDADSGSVPTDAAAYEAGAEVTVQGNTGSLAKSGYTFAGWTLATDGSGAIYKAGDKLTIGAADVTLHAKWTANPTYQVTYDASDADNGTVPTDAAAYEAGAEVTVQGNTGSLAKSGYTFAGWTLAADGTGTVYKAGDKLTIGAVNVTLHAKWTANPTYHVTYDASDADGGTVPTDAAAYEAGAEVTVQGNTGSLAKSGYTFAGWTLATDGSGAIYKAGDKLTIGLDDIRLYAKWEIEPGGNPDPDPDPVAAPKLTSLTLSKGTWSTVFVSQTTEYTITLPADIASLNVTSAAANERQSVTASVYDAEGAKIGGPVLLNAESKSVALGVSAASMQIAVVAEDGKILTYTLHIQREKASEPETPTDPETSTPPPDPNGANEPAVPPFKLTIGGEAQSLIGKATINGHDLDVQLLTLALTAALSSASEGTTVAITAPDDASSLIVRFDAAALNAMKAKWAALELVTAQGLYMLPIADLPIEPTDGATFSLTIGQGGEKTALQLSKAASDAGYTVFGSPVMFELSVDELGRTTIIDSFKSFVKRELPLPAGSDPAGVTAVAVEPDGTLRPVPTEIVSRDGRYYAVVRSLTNSAYALVRSKTHDFTDLSGHWAREAIADMTVRLIVNGYVGGEFRPNAAVSRAEFASILIRALGLPQKSGAASAFTDLKAGAWYGGAVEQAAAYGLLLGGSDGRFRPDDTITREEAFAVVMRAAKLAGTKVGATADSERILQAFADGAAIHGWARSDVAGAVEAGLIQGAGGRLDPAAEVTRAEAATMLRRMLVQAGLIRQ
ncbi:InlB B-repeat-containing protein [Cohnella hashimotonis]|uniref:InlB B-repeat-containing protein n=1 Tax=Cohnella hashimotonis TaxID=2826895 RepID=A0ABT6TP18_9BACL|nr:InlB B-repeat-containing protein [Cohnella hashimotonis]MDI4648581.1 InlB B-repeat-containing protein [Cohnella hashimotonis]